MEYQESGADTASLADPNGFRYGSLAGDGELTLPRASAMPFDVPAAACWHVHLELRPEELLALHKLGLTKGAIAWREGMPAWQPLRENNQPVGVGSEVLARVVESERSEEASPSDWSDAITVASDRISDPSNPILPPVVNDADSIGRLPARARRATLPPTSPLFAAGGRPHVVPVSPPPRTGSSFPPASPPMTEQSAVATMAGATPLLGMPQTPDRLPAAPRLPSFPPPPDLAAFAPHPVASFSPPPTVLEPTGLVQGPSKKSLWVGAIALAAMSALVGSAVSGLFSPGDEPVAEPPGVREPRTGENTVVAAANAATGLAPIPIEELPLAGAKAAAAPAAAEPAAPAASPVAAARPEREPSEGSSRSSSSDGSASSRRSNALAVAAATPARAGDEEPAAPEPVKATGGPDLKAIAKAVSAAARSASSCGDSPQSGKVAITFSPSGSVRSVQMEEAFGERDVGSCVLRAMGRAKVAAFAGDPVMVRKSVTW